jgi:hypothetical protein
MYLNLKVSSGRKQYLTLSLYFCLNYSWCKSHFLSVIFRLMIHGGCCCSVFFAIDLVKGNIFENEMYLTWDVDFECLYNSYLKHFECLYNSYLKHLLSGKNTRSGREEDMTKLPDAFSNFANAPKKFNHYTGPQETLNGSSSFKCHRTSWIKRGLCFSFAFNRTEVPN